MSSIYILIYSSMKGRKQNHLFNMVVSQRRASKINEAEYFNKSIDINMFREQTPEKKIFNKLDPNRSYDYVGIKELQSFQQRMRKTSKKISTFGGSNLARLSSLSKLKEENPLLTTLQLLNAKEGLHSQYCNILSSGQSKNYQTNKYSHNSSSMHQFSSVDSQFNFSLQKVKNKYKNIQDQWHSQEQKIMRKKGFPSLMRLSTEEREKTEGKENDFLKHLKSHLKSQFWESSLRNQQISQAYNKNTGKTKIRKNLMTMNGKNKQDRQKQWVNRKGQQGFRFKMINDSKGE